MKIYTLSLHDEYGAEYMKATTNKDAVMQMLASYSGEVVGPFDCKLSIEEEEMNNLLSALQSDELGKYNLSKGWGGFQLHIVECFEA